MAGHLTGVRAILLTLSFLATVAEAARGSVAAIQYCNAEDWGLPVAPLRARFNWQYAYSCTNFLILLTILVIPDPWPAYAAIIALPLFMRAICQWRGPLESVRLMLMMW